MIFKFIFFAALLLVSTSGTEDFPGHDLSKEPLTRVLSDTLSDIAERSAFITPSEAIALVQNKYLTKDGQDLMKTLMKFANNNGLPFVGN